MVSRSMIVEDYRDAVLGNETGLVESGYQL